jgi:hypothetical protein
MKAYELLDSPEKWIKGAFARDKEGNSVPCGDRKACCWDVLGAIKLCYDTEEERNRVFSTILNHIEENSVAGWNDKSTYKEVHRVLKRLDV